MQRICFLLYGIICYLIFFAAFLWGIAFVADLVPPTLSAAAAPPLQALPIDLGLIALFGVQHSVMARAGFKRWWTRVVPRPIERSTYVLLASLALMLLFWQWRPLPTPVWEARDPLARAALWGLYGLGWLIVTLSTYLIDHFELLGLQQVYAAARERQPARLGFQTPSLYRWVRHPMMFGFLLAFWATPRMTLGHLVFAAGMTFYILIGVCYEERDLVRAFGAVYADYRRRVPMLIPFKYGRDQP